MDSEEEETDVRLQYGHIDIVQDGVCSTMPTPHETSVYFPAHYSGDNVTTQIIKCEDGHSGSMHEDSMRIQQSQPGNTNVTVDEQQQGLNGLECSTSLTNTYNMPTWTCAASEFVEVKPEPDRDSDPGEFDGVSEKTRQWIVDEDGLLKEVKTEPTNWIDETHNCTATSDSDSIVHKRRYTGQRLVCGSMYISDNFPPHNPLLHTLTRLSLLPQVGHSHWCLFDT